MTRWDIEVRNVQLGSTVLGLTWTSTVLMFVGTAVWELIWRKSRNYELEEVKEEKYV